MDLSKDYITGIWWLRSLSIYPNVQRIYKNGDFAIRALARNGHGYAQNSALSAGWGFWV